METIEECELNDQDQLNLVKIDVNIDEEYRERLAKPPPPFPVKVMFQGMPHTIQTSADELISTLKYNFMEAMET